MPATRIDIENGIKQSTALLAIVTMSACRPESFVRRELHYASVLGKPIYPIVPEPVATESMPMQVVDLQQILCPGDFERGVNELLRHLAPLERGTCLIEVSRKVVDTVTPGSVEYALMRRFPLV